MKKYLPFLLTLIFVLYVYKIRLLIVLRKFKKEVIKREENWLQFQLITC